MKFFRKSTALALAMVLTVLLAGGVVSASAQSSSRDAARVAANRSERPGSAGPSASRAPSAVLASSFPFWISNLSSHLIVLTKVTGDASFDGRTPDGTFLPAKSYLFHFFNVQAGPFLSVRRADAHYDILGSDGQPIGDFVVSMQIQNGIHGVYRDDILCRTSIGQCTLSTKADVITLFDPSGPGARSARTSTPPAARRAPLDSTRFLVYNLSRHPIQLLRISGDNNFEGRTADGSILGPESAWHAFEVQIRFLSTQRNTAHYAILGDDGKEIGTFDARMVAELKYPVTEVRIEASCTTSVGTCIVSPAQDVIFLRPPLG